MAIGGCWSGDIQLIVEDGSRCGSKDWSGRVGMVANRAGIMVESGRVMVHGAGSDSR